MPRIVDHEQKKVEIIKASIRVFNLKGYEKTRMADIADEAGVSRTTIYLYYSSKEKILEGIVDYVTNILRDKINYIVVDDNLTFYEKVLAIVTVILKKHKYTSIFLRLVESWMKSDEDTKTQYKVLESYNKKLKELFENLFKDAMKNGEIEKNCHKTLSVILYSIIEGLLEHFTTNDFEEESVEKYVRTVKCLLSGLKNRCVA